MTPYASDGAKERLQKGIKKMEKSLTPKTRVFRRMKSGRPQNLGLDKPTPLQVVNRLFTEIEKAQAIMDEEGIDPKEFRLGWHIFFYVPATETTQPEIKSKWPSRNMRTTTKDAIELLSFFDGVEDPLFLRIQWSINAATFGEEDEDESDVPPDWFTYFNSYPLNTAAITEALAKEQSQK